MSLLTRSARQPGKHRADDRLAKLERHLAEVQSDNARLLNFKAAADDYFMLLVDDRQQVYDAWRSEEQKRADAEIVAACTLSALESAEVELAELRAFKANAEAVNVPPMERDTAAGEDQATEPIDCRRVQAECAAPVPLHASPMAVVTDPGQVRSASWGVDDTQPLKTVGEVA
ncbi:hypothetical protein [Streptomyces formicae]